MWISRFALSNNFLTEGGKGQRAVDRAARGLPVILELFESCIDSLAEGVVENEGQSGAAASSLPEEYASILEG